MFEPSTPGESPPLPPRTFFGRDELIKKITDLIGNLIPIAVIGPGGIGKTSIVLAKTGSPSLHPLRSIPCLARTFPPQALQRHRCWRLKPPGSNLPTKIPLLEGNADGPRPTGNGDSGNLRRCRRTGLVQQHLHLNHVSYLHYSPRVQASLYPNAVNGRRTRHLLPHLRRRRSGRPNQRHHEKTRLPPAFYHLVRRSCASKQAGRGPTG